MIPPPNQKWYCLKAIPVPSSTVPFQQCLIPVFKRWRGSKPASLSQVKMDVPLLFLASLSACFVFVFGYPNGQISDSCYTMLPVHGNNVPQTSTAPYYISVSKNTFNPGDVITVSIQSNSSGTSFKGFIVEARTLGSDRIVGSFTLTNALSRTLTCGTANSAVSHSDSSLKTSITTNWTAETGLGPIRFRATVLNDYSSFWYGVQSEILTALQISNDTCGTDKFCLSNPASCSPADSSCLFMSSVAYNGGYAFEMSGQSTGYLAIGFSDDTLMGNDDVYICTTNSTGSILVQHAFNTGTTTPTILNKNTAGYIMTRNANGILQCSFITQSSISTNISTLTRATTNPTYYIFLARGKSDLNGVIQKHEQRPLVSATKVDLSSFALTSAQTGSPSLTLGHGALMLIAWMTTGSIGMLMARYMKNAAERPILGKAIWFQSHFFLMILTVILTIIAFIMIFAEVAGWSYDTGAHPVLGCIVMILSFFQPILAFFRPDPKSEKRFIFNWGHMLNALVIKVLAVATIFLGLKLIDTTSTLWLSKVMGGFFAWEILFYIILETNMRLKVKEIYENEKKAEPLILGVYIFGNLAFLIALLVGIGGS
ncbi:Hypothetical predicted protein [Pelobates cultripes]|uniref:Ferric-chelate reductase 1 n=1 Tax=Pelobates cultripes TaxID=61616 RepID=A0AAD1SWP5_PELCU|nr:Hypothetical predicted protein [Pelobates cultripes]